MLIHIKYEFLGALKKDLVIFEPEIFEDNGVEYASHLKLIDSSNDSFDNTPVVSVGEAETYRLTMVEGKIQLPPYLALKDLRGYVQAAYPQARVRVVETGSLN